MSDEIVNAIKLLQSRLNKGDQITIAPTEFQIALAGEIPHTYLDKVENHSQLELDL